MHVLHGQRKAVAAVAGPKLALEVGRPDRVGVLGLGGGSAGVPAPHAAAPLCDKAVPVQDVVNGSERGELDLGSVSFEVPGHFLRPVARVLAANLEDGFHHLRRCRLRGAMGPGITVCQPCGAFGRPALQPLVAGLPTDVISPAEFGEAQKASMCVLDEPLTLIHGMGLLERHRAS